MSTPTLGENSTQRQEQAAQPNPQPAQRADGPPPPAPTSPSSPGQPRADQTPASRNTNANRKSTGYVYLVAFIAAVGGFLFGYDTGVVSGAQTFFSKEFGLTPTTQEIAVSAVLIGAVIGAAFGGKLADWLGRKVTLIVMGVIFAVGAILTAIAPGLVLFVVFRILVGFGIGAASVVAPMYSTEMAPTNRRGQMVFIFQFFVTFGILVAYAVDLLFASIGVSWRWMFAVGVIPAIVLGVGMFFLTDTPRWLASKNRMDEARAVLQRTNGEGADPELQSIRDNLASARNSSWKDLLRKGLRAALIVGVLLAIFQQITGINTIIYYTPIIAGYTGFGSSGPSGASLTDALIVGAVNTLATVVAIFLVDRVGRRVLLLVGVGGMVITLAALGAMFLIAPTQLGVVMFIMLLLYIISFAIGLGPVYWLISSEIFPNRLRGVGSSVSTSFNWLANLVVSITFLTLIGGLGKSFTFWLYAAFGVITWLFVLKFIPETKNRPLEQIEDYWRHDRHWDAVDNAGSGADNNAPHADNADSLANAATAGRP